MLFGLCIWSIDAFGLLVLKNYFYIQLRICNGFCHFLSFLQICVVIGQSCYAMLCGLSEDLISEVFTKFRRSLSIFKNFGEDPKHFMFEITVLLDVWKGPFRLHASGKAWMFISINFCPLCF